MWEVAREEMFVEGDVLQRADRLARNAFLHSVDQQEWIAMRQPAQHLVDVHRQDLLALSVLRLGHRSPSLSVDRSLRDSVIRRGASPIIAPSSRRSCAASAPSRQLIELAENARHSCGISRFRRWVRRSSNTRLADTAGNERLAGHHDVIADRQMTGNTDLAADHAALADGGAAGDAGAPAIAVCAPIRTLCAIWIWLSSLTPSPMTVSSMAPRSIVVLGTDLDIVADRDAADLRYLDPRAAIRREDQSRPRRSLRRDAECSARRSTTSGTERDIGDQPRISADASPRASRRSPDRSLRAGRSSHALR